VLGRPLGEQSLEYAPRDPDHSPALADLGPELHGLPVGIPTGVLGQGEGHGDCNPELAPSWARRQKKILAKHPISEISLADHLGVNG
jgi:hypothetical protein